MTAEEAYNYLDSQAWASTLAVEKLALLEDIQKNLRQYADQLSELDMKMKNDFIGTNIYDKALVWQERQHPSQAYYWEAITCMKSWSTGSY